MVFERDTTSSDSWKQRVCGLNDRGTLKTKICDNVFFFSFYLFFLFFSLCVIEISYTLSFVNKFM